jgi:hypothetical protein
MPYILYDSNTKEVTYMTMDTKYLPEDFKARLTSVEVLPVPETQTGKREILKYDPTTQKLYYEYVDRPLTQEEEVAQIRSDLDNAILELSMAIAMQGGLNNV